MATISLDALTKLFGDVTAVDHLTLEIQDDEFVSLLGPSGCGKTTALNMIAGLEEATSGEISLDGVPVTKVPAAARDVAMVFQNYALYPHMTVERNLAFALRIRKVPKSQIKPRVREVAELLGLGDLLHRRPKELSGGQRQRVAIGRAIVRDPKAFLLDEPLSNLDAALRLQMRAELKLLFERLSATVVYVTHDQAEAMTMSDRIAVMTKGRLQQIGTPLEIYHAPVNRFVANFVGSPPMNFTRCEAVEQDSQWRLRTADFELPLPDSTRARLVESRAQSLVLGVRPEDVAVNGRGDVPASCMVVEQLGSETILVVNSGADVYTVQLPGSVPARAGENVALRFDPRKIYLFDADDERALVTPAMLGAQDGVR
jgi:multiple sugar transport system ATP-binding protein